MLHLTTKYTRAYPAVVVRIDSKGGADSFQVLFADFPNCTSTAGTIGDAVMQAKELLARHLGTIVGSGRVPPPASPFCSVPTWLSEARSCRTLANLLLSCSISKSQPPGPLRSRLRQAMRRPSIAGAVAGLAVIVLLLAVGRISGEMGRLNAHHGLGVVAAAVERSGIAGMLRSRGMPPLSVAMPSVGGGQTPAPAAAGGSAPRTGPSSGAPAAYASSPDPIPDPQEVLASDRPPAPMAPVRPAELPPAYGQDGVPGGSDTALPSLPAGPEHSMHHAEIYGRMARLPVPSHIRYRITARCRGAFFRFQSGDELSATDRAYVRNGCRGMS